MVVLTKKFDSCSQVHIKHESGTYGWPLHVIPGPPTIEHPFFDVNLTQSKWGRYVALERMGTRGVKQLEIRELQVWVL